MAIIMCPSQDDKHAPFSHRLIVPQNAATEPLVVCCYCDHWIERVIEKCRCIVQCHAWAIERKTELEAENRRQNRRKPVN